MMASYDAIVGLSGSLGSAAEQQFMRETYGAVTLSTPPFLSTCQGLRKHLPVLVGGCVEVLSTAEAHRERIRELALDFRSRVPVVILANTQTDAKAILSSFSSYEQATGTIQPFFELGADGKPAPYAAIVAAATRPAETERATTWPITVSDIFGGRGQDYTVTDDGVDKAGGILVICSAVAESEREWVQWLGRTARSDRRGQYAVILFEGEEVLKTLPDRARYAKGISTGGLSRKYDEGLISALLDARDVATRTKLSEDKGDISTGMRLHELCDAFWSVGAKGEAEEEEEEALRSTRKPFNKDEWPDMQDDKQSLLRAYLERATKKDGGHNTVQRVAEAAVELGLAPTAAAWKSAASYCKDE